MAPWPCPRCAGPVVLIPHLRLQRVARSPWPCIGLLRGCPSRCLDSSSSALPRPPERLNEGMRLWGHQCWTKSSRQGWDKTIWDCEAANAGRIGTFVSRYVQHAPLVQITICWNFLKWHKAPSSVYQRHFFMATKNKTENWFLKMLKIVSNLSLPDSQIPPPLSVVMWEVEEVWIWGPQMPTAISHWIHQFSSDHWS